MSSNRCLPSVLEACRLVELVFGSVAVSEHLGQGLIQEHGDKCKERGMAETLTGKRQEILEFIAASLREARISAFGS